MASEKDTERWHLLEKDHTESYRGKWRKEVRKQREMQTVTHGDEEIVIER